MTKDQTQEDIKLTPEELDARRAAMVYNYTKSLELLRLQAEHEKLVADIQEHQTRGYYSQLKLVQMMASQKEAPIDPEQEEQVPEQPQQESKVRNLKKTN